MSEACRLVQEIRNIDKEKARLLAAQKNEVAITKKILELDSEIKNHFKENPSSEKVFFSQLPAEVKSSIEKKLHELSVATSTKLIAKDLLGGNSGLNNAESNYISNIVNAINKSPSFKARSLNVVMSEPRAKYLADLEGMVAAEAKELAKGIKYAEKLSADGKFDAEYAFKFQAFIDESNARLAAEISKLNDSGTLLGAEQEAYKRSNANDMLAKRLAEANGDQKKIKEVIDKVSKKNFVEAMHILYSSNGVMTKSLPEVESTVFLKELNGEAAKIVKPKADGLTFDASTNKFEYSSEKTDSDVSVTALAKLYGLDNAVGTDGKTYSDIIALPKELRNIINVAVIPQAEKVATLIAEADDEKLEDIFGVNLNSINPSEAVELTEAFISGYIPQSILVNKLGEEIYRNSPVKFSKVADKDLELKAITELGLLAVMHMKNAGVLEDYAKIDPETGIATSTVTYNNGKNSQVLIKFVGYGEPEAFQELDGTVVPNSRYQQFKALVDAGRELEFLGFTEDRNLPTLEPVTESAANPQHKMRNSTLSYSDEVAKKIDKMNHSPLRFTKDMEKIAQIYADDREKAFKLLGIDHVDTSKNIADQAKEAAKLAYSRMQLDALVNFYNKVGHEQDFYLKYEMTVSERYMVDSIINPQESKIARFLMTGSSFEYDGVNRSGMETTITSKDAESGKGNFELYKLGLAQAFDLGPDKWSDKKSLNELRNKIVDFKFENNRIEPQFKEGIFKDGYESFKKVWNGSATEQDYANVNKAVLKGEKVHVIQAFTSLMELEGHDFRNGDANLAFTFESDAITSGMGLTTAQIGTEEAMALAAKSGIYEEKLYQRWLNVYKKIEGFLSDESKMPINEKGEQYFNHGLILTLSDELQNKEIKMSDSGISTKLFTKILEDAGLNESEVKTLEELRDFRDIYNTVATEADSYIDEMKKDFSSIEKGNADLEVLSKKYSALFSKDKDGNIQINSELYGQAKSILGAMEKIKRSTAKPPTMVYIYGSMMSSIKRKLLGDVFAPQVYKFLNMDIFNPKNEDGSFKDDGFSFQNRITALTKGYSDIEQGIDSHNAKYVNAFESRFADEFKAKDLAVSSPKALVLSIFSVLDKLKYQEYDQIARNMKTIKATEAQGRSLVIDDAILSQFKKASDAVLGEAFTKGFDKFGVVDNFRSIVKQAELVRFTIFKSQLTDRLNKMSKNGEYKISLNDIAEAIMSLQDTGLGHSVRDINGSSQPLYKREKIKGELAVGLSERFAKKSMYGTANDFTYNPNTGASGVVTVHSLDGFIDSTSGMMFNLIRIYDGSVSGTDSMVGSLDEYNKTTGDAISYNVLGNQIKDLASAINSLGGSDKFKEIVEKLSDKDREELTNNFEILMNLGELYDISDERIEQFHSDAQEFIANSESARSENKVRIAHSYITDQAEPQIIDRKLLDGDITSKYDIETVMRSFGELLRDLKEFNKKKIELSQVELVVNEKGKVDTVATLQAFAKANSSKQLKMKFVDDSGKEIKWNATMQPSIVQLQTDKGVNLGLVRKNSSGKFSIINPDMLKSKEQKAVIKKLYEDLGLIDSSDESEQSSEAEQSYTDSNTPEFDKLPFHDENSKTMTYAGIGSRETPKEIQIEMAKAAKYLEELGYTLRSGAADGADKAFEAGIRQEKKEIFLPWKGFNKSNSNFIFDSNSDKGKKALLIAEEMHPSFNKLTDGAKKLQARNTFQIFGQDLDSPVDFVLAWTPLNSNGDAVVHDNQREVSGKNKTGGTGQAISLASLKGIPVVNMADQKWREQLRAIVDSLKDKPIASKNKLKDEQSSTDATKELNSITSDKSGARQEDC